MSWPLFLLVISACLIQDIQSAPKAMSGCLNCRFTPCEQCQILSFMVLYADGDPEYGGARTVEMSCRNERSMEQFCSQIRGKEAEFADTVLDFKKNGTETEVCARADFSVCELSEIGKNWNSPKALSTCEQCQSGVDLIMGWATYDQINGSTNVPANVLPFGRLEFYKVAVDGFKNNCLNVEFGQFFSELCTLIEGKELDFVESVMDCSGAKFKDDTVQPNCTIPGLNVELNAGHKHPERKVCENFVESCKVGQFPFQSEV